MKIVYIEWADACNFQGWIDASEDETNVSIIKTVGYLIEEDSEQIVISSSMSETGKHLGATAIPKGWIKKRRYLK